VREVNDLEQLREQELVVQIPLDDETAERERTNERTHERKKERKIY
jgi:hypothetical protein